MERLNDIFGRMPQYHQQETEQPKNTSSEVQWPSLPPSRYPLQEQTAHLGLSSRSAQSHYKHKISHHTRSEQGPATSRAFQSSYSRPRSEINEPGGAALYPQHSRRQIDLDSHPRNEDLTPTHDRSRGAPRIAPPDSIDAYSTIIESDVREEWEDDTADMRYGDWENDGNEAYIPFRSQEPGAVTHDMHPMSQASAKNSQVYPKNNRSFARQELHMSSDGEPRTQMGRLPGDSHVQQRQLPSPQQLPQEVSRSLRMTQPLKPNVNQDISQEGPHTQKPVSQLARREQAQLYSAANPCPICKGAGYLRADVPYGHPSFGRPIACECKEAERKAKRRRQLQEMSNLGAFYDKSFGNFNPRVPGIQEALRASYEFAQNPNGWLLLIGPNGCGKTHLAAAIANQSLEDGALVLFATVPDLLDHLRAAFAPASTEIYDQLFARMREAEVLVLDDLGAQQSSPWANEKLFQLLNYRYNSRFPTVITANSRGLQGIDERIRSR